jgi:hypothetical protein
MSGMPRLLIQDPIDVLEALCEDLELSETQRANAVTSYGAVSEHLNAADSPIAIYSPIIHPQGSMALGTTVKPLHRSDFDVDLVCHLNLNRNVSALLLYTLVEDRLKAHGTYKDMISRKNRCVRLDYATDYHLDITPAMPNWARGGTHIYVPDRELKLLKDSNPKEFVTWFKTIAQSHPRIQHLTALSNSAGSVRAGVEPLPAERAFEKKLLQRIVQILKRHRDIYFENKGDIAVISVIITTLAARAYRRAVLAEYASLQDFVTAVVADLPTGVEQKVVGNSMEWWIPNPSSHAENFAEKWNVDPRKKHAFDLWHHEVTLILEELLKPKVTGFQALYANSARLMGDGPVRRAFSAHGEEVTKLQKGGSLAVTASTVGLSITSSTKSSGAIIRPNTYFGR